MIILCVLVAGAVAEFTLRVHADLTARTEDGFVLHTMDASFAKVNGIQPNELIKCRVNSIEVVSDSEAGERCHCSDCIVIFSDMIQGYPS